MNTNVVSTPEVERWMFEVYLLHSAYAVTAHFPTLYYSMRTSIEQAEIPRHAMNDVAIMTKPAEAGSMGSTFKVASIWVKNDRPCHVEATFEVDSTENLTAQFYKRGKLFRFRS